MCSMFMYETIISETYLDFLGHMNNARYLELFEQARWEYITQAGYGLSKIRELQQGPVILEVNLRFVKELKEREKVKISMELAEYKGKISKIKQQMFNDKNEVCAELMVTAGLFDLKTRRLINPNAEWSKALGIKSESIV